MKGTLFFRDVTELPKMCAFNPARKSSVVFLAMRRQQKEHVRDEIANYEFHAWDLELFSRHIGDILYQG